MKTSIKDVILNPAKIIKHLGGKGYFKWMPDELYLRICYRAALGKRLDLENPKGFNEKLQWLKLYDHNPVYTTMVDKSTAKDYVAKIIGEQYIIPTYGVWDKFEDIDFDSLPNQFVLKCTHDSGGLVICKNKAELNMKATEKKIKSSLKRQFYYVGREWAYKNVKPRIIAEKLMTEPEVQDLDDYKLMTTINRCNNIRYKEILDKEFIDIVDIYFINKNSANGWCNGSDYGINISYDYNKDINLYQYINLYNDKSIKEAFEKVLNNEINITSAFIEMVEESYNEKV